jgi:hypothetical protein
MARILSWADETRTASDLRCPSRRLVASSPRYISGAQLGKARGSRTAKEVSLRIDRTPGEARRLLGAPDPLALRQVLALALEDGLVWLLARLDRNPALPQRTHVGQEEDDV